MESCWIHLGPRSSDWCPCGERRGHGRCREGYMNATAEVGAMQLQAKEHQIAAGPRQLGRGQAGPSTGAFRGSMVLPTP